MSSTRRCLTERVPAARAEGPRGRSEGDQPRRGDDGGRRLGHRRGAALQRGAAGGGKRPSLCRDVEVDDAVIQDVDLPVVVEIAVVPAEHAAAGADVKVDLAVV